MDWFYVGNYAGSVGLNDIYLKGKFKVKKHKFGADAHAFLGAAAILDKGEVNTGVVTSTGSYLGTELDLYYETKLNKSVTFKGGYSQMFMTKSMTYVKGGNTYTIQNWAYVILIFKPTLFTHKTVKTPLTE
jgi:hypothetical protein